MNTKEYFDAKIELYKLVSGHTEDTMIDSLRRMGESMPQDASEEELSQAFAKVYAEQLQLLNNPQDGSIVVASAYMTSITNVVQEYLDVKKWRYNIIPFGAEVILYRIPFNVNNGNLINLDIAVKENPNILEIDAHIPYDTAVVEDIGSVISVANSDPDRKLGALIYSSFSEELSYSYRIITNHGLYIDDLDLAVTEVLTWATTIYGTLKGRNSTNRQEDTILCDTYEDSEGTAETTETDSLSIPKDGLDDFSLQEKKQDFVKGFNVLSILTLGPGKYCISKNIDNHSDVMIDDGGYIWVRNLDSGDSVRTTVNVMEARLAADGCGGKEGVYALCEDGTGLHFAEDDIYYIIDGEYSGWGTAYEHFKEFPNGDSRSAHARVEEAMRQWACKHDLEKLDTATDNADVGLDGFEIEKDRGLNNYSDCEEHISIPDKKFSGDDYQEEHERLEGIVRQVIEELGYDEEEDDEDAAIDDFEIDEDGELLSYSGCEEHVTIPEGVTWIGEFAFSGADVKSVTIPEGVYGIGIHAFTECTELTTVILPDSLKYIQNCAFNECKSLSSITIPDNVEEINSGAFTKCDALADEDGWVVFRDICFDNVSDASELRIPDNVRIISGGAFKNLPGLKTVFIPENVEEVRCWSFGNCKNLESAIFLNDAVEIENGVFSDCDHEKLVVYAHPGSTAEQYAAERGMRFSPIFAHARCCDSDTKANNTEELPVQGKKYDYLALLGYGDSEIHSYSRAGNEAILDYLEDNKDHVLENMRYLQSDFDKDFLLKLPVFYPDAFVLTPEIFSERFEMLKNKFPYDYADIVQKQFWGYEGYDSVYVTMAEGFTSALYEPFLGILYKDDQSVKAAVESLDDPASRQYKFIAMLQKDIGLDVSTDDIQEECLLDLECGKWEVLENAKDLIADGLTKDLLLELLWYCPHILTYSTSELECILTEHFGDDYIEVLIQKYDNDDNLGDELIEL